MGRRPYFTEATVSEQQQAEQERYEQTVEALNRCAKAGAKKEDLEKQRVLVRDGLIERYLDEHPELVEEEAMQLAEEPE